MELRTCLDIQNACAAVVQGAEAVNGSGNAKNRASDDVLDALPVRAVVLQKTAVGFQVSGGLEVLLRLLSIVDHCAGCVDTGAAVSGHTGQPRLF